MDPHRGRGCRMAAVATLVGGEVGAAVEKSFGSALAAGATVTVAVAADDVAASSTAQ
ncbi:hypothetical protein [Mycolicibacterium tokaiense]|uniref:hypothetical protein n=1 Tax=Mycolicibacterium tokaiense TaxID=39695 RepID=UPI001559745A|nr:hypothetical protein [Mycolicibacterium tokaiense]